MNNVNSFNSNSDNFFNNNALVFIDSNLDNYQNLVAAVSTAKNTEVVLLDSTRDGVEQITETLVNYSELDSVHIISHGQAGVLQLGSTNLQTENFDRYSAELQGWSDFLSEDADILLYGCEIGSRAAGIDFLESFSQLTKADIAASNDLTGNIELGGNWNLEAAVGEIEANSIYSDSLDIYDSVLAIENENEFGSDDLDLDFDTFSNTEDLVFNGNASNLNNRLRLTSTTRKQHGSVFYDKAQAIDTNTSFSTQFQFQISGGAKGADGFTFMLQNDDRALGAIGGKGGGLGYRGIENSLAIEFDSFQNIKWESDNNHVSILQNGNVRADLATATAAVDFNGGGLLNAWIDYNGQNDLLEVYLGDTLDRPDEALLSLEIDLNAVVGERAFVGFSAATGGRVNNHDILAWKLDWNPDFSTDENGAGLNPLIDFNNFADLDRLQLNDDAFQTNNVLQLTANKRSQVGSVFYDEPIQVNDETSFSTQFQFQIGGGTDGADGFTFMLQNNLSGDLALGSAGGGLGYRGIANSLAIEFDTFKGQEDLNDNHLSVLLNGNTNNAIATINSPFDLNSGQALAAWIDYDGSTDLLEIFLSDSNIRPESATLSTTIDLADVVGNRARIGFSAATGGRHNSHDILNWSFASSDGLAPEGNFSNLINWSSVAIHAGLTPDGKVLTYGLDSNFGNPDSQDNTKFTIWDPTLGTEENAFTVLNMSHPVDSAFCSGMILLPDGQMLIAGGSIQGDRNAGNDLVHLYNYRTGEVTMLSEENDLLAARWYPTMTTLTDGRILLQGGRNAGETGGVITPEIYTSGQGSSWLDGAASEKIYNEGNQWWYPRSWVAPNGKVFGLTNDDMYYLDPDGDGAIETVGTFDSDNRGNRSTAVMYDRGKILQVGGNSNEATIIDINGGTPVLSSAGTMNHRRLWGDSTVLPDGTVFVSGGSSQSNLAVDVAYAAEIWNPKTNTWTVVDSASTLRLYHSTSLLLPDATVLTAGGTTLGYDDEALTGEVYRPGYLYDEHGNAADRPTIASNEKLIDWNEAITATVGQGDKIERVTLVSFGAVTHSFDMGQRFLELDFTQSGNELTINTPESANIAPPGFYMMFAIDEHGVPSEAKIFQIAPEGVEVDEILAGGSMNHSGHDGMHMDMNHNTEGMQMGNLAHSEMEMNHNANCTEC